MSKWQIIVKASGSLLDKEGISASESVQNNASACIASPCKEDVGEGWEEISGEPETSAPSTQETIKQEYRSLQLQKPGTSTEWSRLNRKYKQEHQADYKKQQLLEKAAVAVFNQALMNGESIPGDNCKNAKIWSEEEVLRRYAQMQKDGSRYLV